MHNSKANKIAAFYATNPGFSGQLLMTELVIRGLKERGWQISNVLTPALDRKKPIDNKIELLFEGLKLSFKLLVAWFKGIAATISQNIIYVSIGQTKYGLLRDGFPLLIRSFFSQKKLAIISFHGSLFFNWDEQSWETKFLHKIAKVANFLTILGPTQKDKLIELGIPKEQIAIVDNTCLLSPISELEVRQKHEKNELASENSKTITVLYLSNLLETKGYVEFVEAIEYLSVFSELCIEVKLCGQIVINGKESDRFLTHVAAQEWIESQIERINQSHRIRLHWINGATGKDKEKLFHEAQIFVLPSRYKVEAQPIAILEALASGCVVITTKVGEIPTTVSEQTALLLESCSSFALAQAISELSDRAEKRQELALNGLKLYQERFSYEKHIDRWEKLLESFYN